MKIRAPERWRRLSSETTDAIKRAIAEFCRWTGLTQGELAEALYSSRVASLSKHGDAWILHERLRRDTLPEIAARLKLDAEGFKHLERLVWRIEEEIGGYTIKQEEWEGSKHQALEMGKAGLEAYRLGNHLGAQPLLNASWERLRSPDLPQPGQREFPITLQVGAMRLHWQSYTGDRRVAWKSMVPLVRLVKNYRPPDLETLEAIGHVYKAYSGVGRRSGMERPSYLLMCGRTAHQLLTYCARELEQHGGKESREAAFHLRCSAAAALGGQVEPNLRLGLGLWGGSQPPTPCPERIDATFQGLEEVTRLTLALGSEHDAARSEWIVNRTRWIDSLAAVGRFAEVPTRWDDLMAVPWRDEWVTTMMPRLRMARLRFTELPVQLARNQLARRGLDGLAETARRFREEYGDAVPDALKAAEIESAATHGDLQGVQHALVFWPSF